MHDCEDLSTSALALVSYFFFLGLNQCLILMERNESGVHIWCKFVSLAKQNINQEQSSMCINLTILPLLKSLPPQLSLGIFYDGQIETFAVQQCKFHKLPSISQQSSGISNKLTFFYQKIIIENSTQIIEYFRQSITFPFPCSSLVEFRASLFCQPWVLFYKKKQKYEMGVQLYRFYHLITQSLIMQYKI